MDYNDEYIVSLWNRALDSFEVLYNICKKGQYSDFINYEVVLERARDTLNEESDFSKQIEELKSLMESAAGSSSSSSSSSDVEPTIAENYFITDAKEMDMKFKKKLKFWPQSAMLQLRGVSSDISFTLVVPWDDYFYACPAPDESLDDLRLAINNAVSALSNEKKRSIRVQITEEDNKRSMYGYVPKSHVRTMLRVTTQGPWISRKLFRVLTQINENRQIFEATKPDYLTKFMAHNNLSGCCAVKFAGSSGQLVRFGRTSFYRYIGGDDAKIERIPDDPSILYVPRVLMMDAEMCSQDPGVFPEADLCPVIAISWVFCLGNEPQSRGVIGLGGIDKDNPLFTCVETEMELFLTYAKLLRDLKVEVVMGFNSNKFDNRYFIDRCEAIGAGPAALAWGPLGIDEPAKYSIIKMHTNQAGDSELLKLNCFGITFFDIYQVLMKDVTKSLRSYSLRNVCDEFLADGFNKLDLKYSDIPKLFKHPEGRRTLYEYALRDVEVLVELDRVLMYGSQQVELSKTLGCTLEQTLNRGVTFKLSRKLMEYTIRENFVIPSFVKDPVKLEKYDGALVLPPTKGMHECCTPVFDFASLYPSCMISGNVSWDSHLPRDPSGDEALGLKPEDIIVAPNKERFVRHEVHFGLASSIEEELFIERKRLKKLKAKAPPGSVERAVRDGQQLAVKLVMNSLYGYLGATTTAVPDVALAATVTSWGREMLMEAKGWFEGPAFAKSFPGKRCSVVYGDTDSVFIRMPDFGVDKKGVADCFDFCENVETVINRDVFSKYRKQYLEFEKILCNLVLVECKKYTSLKVEGRDKKTGLPNPGKLSTTGLELVRRDNCPLCQRVVKAFIENSVVVSDKAKAMSEVKRIVTDLYQDILPLEDFVISKKIAKAEYKKEPGHVRAWRAQRERYGTALACEIGERFEYIVKFTGEKWAKTGDKVVDLMSARDDKLSPDHDYYFDTFVKQPLERVAVHILSKSEVQQILDKNRYERRNTVRASKRNLLSHFGVTSMTTVKKAKK